MEGLQDVVLVAGRNGSGKSRFIDALRRYLGSRETPDAVERTMMAIETRISQFEAALKQKQNTGNVRLIKDLEGARRELQLTKTRLDNCNASAIEGAEHQSAKHISLRFRAPSFTDPAKLAPASLMKSANSVSMCDDAEIYKNGVLPYIQRISNQYFSSSHPEISASENDKKIARDHFISLDALLEKYLGTKLGRELNDQATIFGRPLGKANLSEGQKVLLSLCVALHAKGASLNDHVIFMDEPEVHLHPSALLETLDAIRANIGNGQLWIATHSLHVLAHYGATYSWWMEEGKISKVGSSPQKAIEGLVGDEVNRGKLAAFLDLPFAYASNCFTAECLVPPEVVAHDVGDPQEQQIAEIINELKVAGQALRVLDYGAGKGRLAAELAEYRDTVEAHSIDYIAFDVSDEDKEICETSIKKLHNEVDGRWFSDWTQLDSRLDPDSVDLVVLCNVLHEIPVDRWNNLFGADGRLTKILKPSGYLLIVEVQQLPYGERAHQHGFLVLDEPQLRKLFAMGEVHAADITVDSRKGGWLKAHLIKRDALERYTPELRRPALQSLADHAKSEIAKYRDGTLTDHRAGKLHGFWVNQYANAILALEGV